MQLQKYLVKCKYKVSIWWCFLSLLPVVVMLQTLQKSIFSFCWIVGKLTYGNICHGVCSKACGMVYAGREGDCSGNNLSVLSFVCTSSLNSTSRRVMVHSGTKIAVNWSICKICFSASEQWNLHREFLVCEYTGCASLYSWFIFLYCPCFCTHQHHPGCTLCFSTWI